MKRMEATVAGLVEQMGNKNKQSEKGSRSTSIKTRPRVARPKRQVTLDVPSEGLADKKNEPARPRSVETKRTVEAAKMSDSARPKAADTSTFRPKASSVKTRAETAHGQPRPKTAGAVLSAASSTKSGKYTQLAPVNVEDGEYDFDAILDSLSTPKHNAFSAFTADALSKK